MSGWRVGGELYVTVSLRNDLPTKRRPDLSGGQVHQGVLRADEEASRLPIAAHRDPSALSKGKPLRHYGSMDPLRGKAIFGASMYGT